MSGVHALVVCDVHYEGGYAAGVDTSGAWRWLLRLVERLEPRFVLSCGDHGAAARRSDFERLAGLAVFLAVYGNHENFLELRRARNRLGEWSGAPVLLGEGRVYDLDGLTVAGIHGAVLKRRRPGAPPPRSPSEIWRAARKIDERLNGGRLDVLLMHETPYYPEAVPGISETPGSLAARRAVETVRPRLVVGGHAHLKPTLAWAGDTLIAHIDSSQKTRSYLTLTLEGGRLRVELWSFDEGLLEAEELGLG